MLPPQLPHIPSKDELTQIIEIAQSYVLGTSDNLPSGFLTRAPSIEELEHLVLGKNMLVVRRDNRIAGYVTLYQATANDPEMEATRAKFKNISWQAPLPPLEELIYCDQIAIHPKFRRTGVASELLHSLFATHPNSFFLVAVVEGPIRNNASISLCLKHGFQRIGVRVVPEYRGLKQFQSGWYLRNNCQLPSHRLA